MGLFKTLHLLCTFFILAVFGQNCGGFKPSMASVNGSGQASFGQSQSYPQMKAQLMMRRLASRLPVDHPDLESIANLIRDNQELEAARKITHRDDFLNITIRDFAAKMSNREQMTNVELNDFTASIIGLARDDDDARKILTGRSFYWAPDSTDKNSLVDDYIKSNNHFADIDRQLLNLSEVLMLEPEQLVLTENQQLTALRDPAGVITSRAFMSSHAGGGTNRRLVEFSFSQFLCAPIETWANGSVSHSFIGRDISRSPSESFQNKCSSCHAPMDAMRPAFAHVDFKDGFFQYKRLTAFDPRPDDATRIDQPVSSEEQNVPSKFRRGKETFPFGHKVMNDQWMNLTHSQFGWRTDTDGAGMNQFGAMIAQSKQFSRCMAQRAFQTVCVHDEILEQESLKQELADHFEASGYNLRELFARVIIHPNCLKVVKL